MSTTSHALPLIDQRPTTTSFRNAVLEGLRRSQKEVPSKYLYDERGSKLFDAICEQEEYYPTRIEMEIMERYASSMADTIGPRSRLVEYGSGSSRKTRILLDHLEELPVYVPVDISRRHLIESAEALAEDYPGLCVQPLCADYTADLELPDPPQPVRRTVVYYPGSTIGNFQRNEAQHFLRRIAATVGEDGGLLIGVDLKKDIDVLRAAYNDAAGVTAAFNKNLLRRMNRELDATFDLDRFEHEGIWNDDEGCIEMHLRSLERQTVSVAGQSFSFDEGETIRTEYSYKYTLDGFASLAEAAGWAIDHVWTDDRPYFSVQYCSVAQ